MACNLFFPEKTPPPSPIDCAPIDLHMNTIAKRTKGARFLVSLLWFPRTWRCGPTISNTHASLAACQLTFASAECHKKRLTISHRLLNHCDQSTTSCEHNIQHPPSKDHGIGLCPANPRLEHPKWCRCGFGLFPFFCNIQLVFESALELFRILERIFASAFRRM